MFICDHALMQKKIKLNLILKYNIVSFFLYSIINIDLNVPCYFVTIIWIEKLLALKKI
jgi:hypothetical protein